jgi:hypothetical protein
VVTQDISIAIALTLMVETREIVTAVLEGGTENETIEEDLVAAVDTMTDPDEAAVAPAAADVEDRYIRIALFYNFR